MADNFSNYSRDILLFKFKKIIAFVIVIMLLNVLLLTGDIFAHEDIDISTDNLEYSEEQGGRFSARGSVILYWGKRKIFADYLEFILGEKTITAGGNVKVEESGSIIHADSVKYNYDKKSSEIKEVFGYSRDIFIRAKYLGGIGKDTKDANDNDMYAIRDIKLSTCDLDDTHFYLKARRGKLQLNKMVTLYNPVIYIGKIPVFYLPIFWKSLDKESFLYKLKVNPQLSYGKKRLSLKTELSFPLFKHLTLGFVFDAFHLIKSDSEGTLDYITKDLIAKLHVFHKPSDKHRKQSDQEEKDFYVNFNYFQIINHMWTSRAKGTISIINSKSISEDNYTHASLSMQTNNINLNFGIALPSVRRRFYLPPEGYNNYENLNLIRPAIDFTWYHKFNFYGIVQRTGFMWNSTLIGDYYLRNRYNQEYDTEGFFYNAGSRRRLCKEAHSNLTYKQEKMIIKQTICINHALTRSFSLGERTMLKPNLELLAIFEVWNRNYDFNIFLKPEYIVGFSPRCVGSLNLRHRVLDWMEWDFNFCLLRLKNEKDLLNFSHYYFYHPKSSFTSYMYIRDKAVIKTRLSYDEERLPFVTELTWIPGNFIIANVKHSQSLYPFKVNYFQFYSKIGKLDRAYLNFNFFCGNREINTMLGFGFWITSKWRFDCNFTTQQSSIDLSHFKVDKCEFKIFRDLHCYNFFLGVRFVRDVSRDKEESWNTEVFARIDTESVSKSFRNKKYFNDLEATPLLWLHHRRSL